MNELNSGLGHLRMFIFRTRTFTRCVTICGCLGPKIWKLKRADGRAGSATLYALTDDALLSYEEAAIAAAATCLTISRQACRALESYKAVGIFSGSYLLKSRRLCDHRLGR